MTGTTLHEIDAACQRLIGRSASMTFDEEDLGNV